MSSPDPKEAWSRIQNELTRRTARFGGAGGGGPPKGLFGGIGGLILVGGGIWMANNALFNGAFVPASEMYHTFYCIGRADLE
jgi:prohibitin 2